MTEERKLKLTVIDGRPDQEFIELLEKALKDAKEGNVTGGVLLLTGPGGSLRQDMGGTFHSGELMLQMKYVEQELLDLEFSDDDDDNDDPGDNGGGNP